MSADKVEQVIKTHNQVVHRLHVESFRLSVLEALNEYMLESIHDDEELWKITVADKQLALKDFAKYLGAATDIADWAK